MTTSKWVLGEIYRDKASSRNPDDQFLGWFRTSDDRSIGNASGIRSLRFSPGVDSTGAHACVVLVTSELRNDRSVKWIDPLPDYESGDALYWGDAQAGKDKSVNEWSGNRILLDSVAVPEDPEADPVPVLLFSKPRRGEVRFLGLGFIGSVEEKTQRQIGGQPVQNLEAAVTILDCREVDPEWIRRRAVEGPPADAQFAPEAWRSLKDGNLRTIRLSKDETEALKLPIYPQTAREVFHFVTPDDIVAAIARFDAGESAGFSDSREYDLIFDGNRYPPKAIAGMASKRILGRDATPGEFSGGKGTSAFKMFSRLGFEWASKEGSDELSDGILLTWNKARWNWTDLADHIANVRSGEQAADDETVGKNRWSVGNRKSIPAGTRFFLIKLGQQPKGIIGCGKTASEVYQDTHFDPDKAAKGEKANYVKLLWEELVDPFSEGTLDVSKFEEPELTSVHWSSQQSGINILANSLAVLEEKWSEFLQSIDRKKTDGTTEVTVPKEAYSMDQATSELFMDPEEFRRIVESLRKRKNVILQGPPGVGKSFIAKRIAYALLGEKDPDRIEMVQFHQSYSYEDFIQGYRPAKKGFKRANGVFYRFSRMASADNTDRPYVFIVDEINRGNLAAILGEVMLLIESDKRGPEYAIPLTYSSERDATSNPENYRFYVPENLFILGLMNTADRSLALVDYALRRRFRFFSLWPQFNERFRKHLTANGCDPSVVAKITERISEINKQISDDYQNLGPGYQIGHSYFCPNGDEPTEDWYRAVVKESIEPLLDEYFGIDDPGQVAELTDWLLS